MIDSDPAALIKIFEARIKALETANKNLEDRVAVLEDLTCDHESRLEDLEEKADGDDWIDGAD